MKVRMHQANSAKMVRKQAVISLATKRVDPTTESCHLFYGTMRTNQSA